MNWNKKSLASIVTKYPALEGKPESVAIAVWALAHDKNMTPEAWRALSSKTGVVIAGRAVGSARQIVGLSAGKPARASGSKRGPGRPKGSKNKSKKGRPVGSGRGPGRPRKASNPSDALNEILSSVRDQQRASAQLTAALEKIRGIIDSVL